MKELGPGGIDDGFKTTRRDLDVEDLLDSLAARGFFDEDDELFARTPDAAHGPKPVTPAADPPRSTPAPAQPSAAPPQPHLGATAPKRHRKRDLYNVESLMDIIARGYYGANDD